MQGGLNNLEQRYKNIRIFRENNIYIKLESYSKEHQVKNFLQIFFKDLETTITSYVKDLSQGWIESALSIDEITIPEEHIKGYGSEMIIVDHPSMGEADELLRILAKQYNFYPDVLDITNFTKKEIKPRRDFIIGKKDFVTKFINMILVDLSPSYYHPQSTESKTADVTLKDLCIQSISRYSLFYPEVFSINILSNCGLPEHFLKQIEEYPMEHAQKWLDIYPFKGKIVIFKTTSFYLGSNQGYLIYPERKELKVGLITNQPSHWDGGETGYNLGILLNQKEVGSNHALVTSKIKYSNFKIRLPLPSEVDKIKNAVLNDKASFGLSWGMNILKIIDSQKKDSENIISEEMAKLFV